MNENETKDVRAMNALNEIYQLIRGELAMGRMFRQYTNEGLLKKVEAICKDAMLR